MAKEHDDVVVRLQSAALDDKNGEIVAHGWLDIDAINKLRVGDYQREILQERSGGGTRKSVILKAIEAGERMPDILLGMRGQRYTESRGSMNLENDVYIIDGLQRVSALRKFASSFPERAKEVRIGAEVRFNTTRDSEKELFTKVNLNRKAMAPSVVLRNERNRSEAMATLYGLSVNDAKFALCGKVCWDQQMDRGELVTGQTFGRVMAHLHRHLAPGGRTVGKPLLLVSTLDAMAKACGLQNFRYNVNNFYEVMDEVWGVRGLKYKDRATHLRGNFMLQLAGGVFSDHEDFWDGKKLFVDANMKRKLKAFPIEDPTIIRLAGAGSNAGDLLRRHMIDHLNKGKQVSNHLKARRIPEFMVRDAKTGKYVYAQDR